MLYTGITNLFMEEHMGHYVQYIEKRFNRVSQTIIDVANSIIDEYQKQGFKLTLRQLYYQFVARDLLPNKQASYDKLGRIISDARLAGLVAWDAIEDRTRFIRKNSHWEHPKQVLLAAKNSFYMDKWQGQDCHVEVWIEKDALVGVIEPICSRLDVTYFSCRGYVSQSEMWNAAERLLEHEDSEGQAGIILHLGDHDPSGIDMTRDISDRLTLFGCKTEVKRIALTMEQVQELNPPPNPAKITDSRATEYIAKYGSQSWELDALDPTYLERLIRENVLWYRDEDIYQGVLKQEQEHLKTIDSIIKSVG